MLTTAFVTFATFMLHRFANFEISLQLESTFKILPIIIIILTFLFWTIHTCMYGEKDQDRYEYLWEENCIQLMGLVYAGLNVVALLIMEENFKNGDFIFSGTYTFIIAIIAIDIVIIPVIYHSYSYKWKQSIVDGLLFQIGKMRNALFVIIIISCALKFTIFGLLMLFLTVVIFLSIFKII